MRTPSAALSPSLLSALLTALFLAACLSACSPSPDDEPVANAADTAPTAQTAAPSSPDADSATASGAAAISFNAAQTADSDAWFTQIEGASACAANASPAEAIARLQAIGASPSSLDTNAADGSLSEIVVSWSDGHGPKSTTYYRKPGDCEANLPSEQTVPAQYR